jgi:4-diphosphocytidyl-2-C-methyl-D-erythritol kinase
MNHESLSPAKVNLLLKVISKRPDGYHNLVSIVDPISIYDSVLIKERKQNAVSVKDPSGILPDGPTNTIFRAAMLIKETFGIHTGVEVTILKKIPMGSGLGGGSGNAATVIKELVRFWDLKIDFDELISLGRKIGSDVPLFLYGRPCVISGVGEMITPISLPSLCYIIIYPNVVLSTREVYEGLRIVLTKEANEVTFSGPFLTARDIAEVLENDLEPVAFKKCPIIKTIKERLLQSGAVGALMSGSGSAVFGIFENRDSAANAVHELADLGRVFIADSIR